MGSTLSAEAGDAGGSEPDRQPADKPPPGPLQAQLPRTPESLPPEPSRSQPDHPPPAPPPEQPQPPLLPQQLEPVRESEERSSAQEPSPATSHAATPLPGSLPPSSAAHPLVLGVLCLDHPGAAAGPVTCRGASGYTLSFVNTRISPSSLREMRDDEGAQAALAAAVGALVEAHGQALVAVTCDSLIALSFPDGLADAAEPLNVLPSPLYQAPLALAGVSVHARLLVLVEVSGAVEEMHELTPQLLAHGMALHPHDRERILVEAVQGCAALSLPDGTHSSVVRRLVLDHVRQVMGSLPPPVFLGGVLIDSPQLLPHSDALRAELGIPVFDSLSLLGLLSLSAPAPGMPPKHTPASLYPNLNTHQRQQLEGAVVYARTCGGSAPPCSVDPSSLLSVRVGPRSMHTVGLAPHTDPAVLEYAFALDEDTIRFIVQADGRTLVDELVEPGDVHGSVELGPGASAELRFDNRSSWVRGRSVRYGVAVNSVQECDRRTHAHQLKLRIAAAHAAAAAAAAQATLHRGRREVLGARAQAAASAHHTAAAESTEAAQALQQLCAELAEIEPSDGS